MHVELRDEARDDLVDGAIFYGEQYRDFHRSLPERFPYAIYCLVSDELVDVVAILDCRSDPAAIDSRLGRTKP